MSEPTVREVRDCCGCPLAYLDGPDTDLRCDNGPDGRLIEGKRLPPSWCPLRAGPVVVRLREGAL